MYNYITLWWLYKLKQHHMVNEGIRVEWFAFKLLRRSSSVRKMHQCQWENPSLQCSEETQRTPVLTYCCQAPRSNKNVITQTKMFWPDSNCSVIVLPLFDSGSHDRQRLVAKLLPQLAERAAVCEAMHGRLPSGIVAARPLWGLTALLILSQVTEHMTTKVNEEACRWL